MQQNWAQGRAASKQDWRVAAVEHEHRFNDARLPRRWRDRTAGYDVRHRGRRPFANPNWRSRAPHSLCQVTRMAGIWCSAGIRYGAAERCAAAASAPGALASTSTCSASPGPRHASEWQLDVAGRDAGRVVRFGAKCLGQIARERLPWHERQPRHCLERKV